MCIAILKTKDAEIPDEYLEESFDNNRDGAGLAYANNNKLYTVKGIFNKKEFVKAVRKAEKESQGAMLIHCRIGTHGLKDKNNCHPHVISNKCVLIHNGILRIDMPNNSKDSDTIWYIRKYLKPLSRDFMYDDAICQLIEMSIGYGNKFVLLSNKGEYRIINENAGHWENGVWYSNYSYKPPIKYESKWKDLPLFRPPIAIDEEKVIAAIQALSNPEIIALGEYPVIDLVKGKFVPETEAVCENPDRYRYLDDISEAVYEAYNNEIELRGLMNEVLGQDEEEPKKAG